MAWAPRRRNLITHSSCWRAHPPGPVRAIDERTRARHAAVHQLREQGVGLLECARHLGWVLNTVSATPAPPTAEQLQRPPRYSRRRGRFGLVIVNDE